MDALVTAWSWNNASYFGVGIDALVTVCSWNFGLMRQSLDYIMDALCGSDVIETANAAKAKVADYRTKDKRRTSDTTHQKRALGRVPAPSPENSLRSISAVNVNHCCATTQASEFSDVVSPEEMELMVESFAQLLSQMQPTRPDIVRGIRAFRVLQKSPWLWRRGH